MKDDNACVENFNKQQKNIGQVRGAEEQKIEEEVRVP